MKKTLGIAATLLCLATLPAFAGPNRQRNSSGEEQRVHGTITSWDVSTHTVHIAQAGGGDSVFRWNESTQIHGTPKVGEMIKLEFERDPSGTPVARRILAKDPSERRPAGERSLSRS
jgi:hypothetical protein